MGLDLKPVDRQILPSLCELFSCTMCKENIHKNHYIQAAGYKDYMTPSFYDTQQKEKNCITA
jgi:hypothetical protein